MTRIFIEKMPQVQNEEQKRHLIRYVKFINSRPERELKQKSFHTHHIYPKSLAKKNNVEDYDGDWNLIELTPHEHYVAHMILWKCGYKEMATPFLFMQRNKVIISGRQYEKLCFDNANSQKNKVISVETRLKLSNALKKYYAKQKSNPLKGRKCSKEFCENQSKTRKGKKFSEEYKKEKYKTRGISIKCLETDEVFEFIKDAIKKYGSKAYKSLRTQTKIDGHTFVYLI